MSSPASINPGLANLLQTLTNVNSPVLSLPNAMSALENASPTDIVKLSAAATQLEGVSELFGISDTSTDSASTDLSIQLANLEASLTGSNSATAANTASTTASGSTASVATQITNYQSALQSAETDALLGVGSTGIQSDSLLSVLG